MKTHRGSVIVFARSFNPVWPVVLAITDRAVGIAKVNANHALNPIQKKISQMPWLQAMIQPRNGWRTRDTKT